MVYVLSNTPLFSKIIRLDIHLCKNVSIYYNYHNKMEADKHCFTPVKIEQVADDLTSYKITSVRADADGVDIPYDVDQVYVEYAPVGEGAATSIKFFKFTDGNTEPKYIAKHNDAYDVAGEAAVIIPNNTYLVMLKKDQTFGGSKSARKGRKSARKGRKSARKSRRSRGSRSKK